jgi:hypothetical protein
MAYEEYDYYNEPSTGSLKDSLYQILNGLQDRTKLREAGISLKEALQLTPNVTESLGRGGVAQAIGTSGDLRDLSNTINSYLPKGVRNFTRAAEFLANPYATAIQQTAPTTEQTLDFVPRVTDPYEGYKQHETLGEYVAPASAYLGGKAAKAYANYVGPRAYKAIEDYMVKTGGILPMEAWHGTNADIQGPMTANKAGEANGLAYGPGGYFAESPDIAKGFGKNLYKVDIPDEYLPNMINWYEPISKQTDNVKQALTKLTSENSLLTGQTKKEVESLIANDATGQDLFNLFGKDQKELSNVLQSVGLKGVKYENFQIKGGKGADTNNYVVFDPTDVKLLEKNGQKLASEIDELGFHSPLENAILKIQQPKGTGEQFLKQLERTPGVKAEELEVTGLKQYLLDHSTVTKQQLQNYMDTNRVSLQNKVLDESMSGADTYDEYSLRGGEDYHDQDYIDSTAEDLRYQLENDADIYHQEQEAIVERFPELYEGHELDPNVAARLHQHVEENIRELADTQAKEMYYENPIRHYYDDYGYDIYGNDDMGYSIKDPQGRFLDIGPRNGIYDIDEAQDALRQHLLDEGVIDIGSEGGPKYEDYTLPGNYTNYREILTTIPENLQGNLLGSKKFNELQQMIKNGSMKFDSPEYKEYDSLVKQATNKKFESGHFDEPNVLAHMRVDDRIINGKKTLMVEEIQSDWHQKGRRQGYQSGKDIEKQYENFMLDMKKQIYDESVARYTKEYESEPHLRGLMHNIPVDEFADRAAKTHISNMKFDDLAREAGRYDEWKKLYDELAVERNGVPNAPFKKNWHELMMKQIINEAVKGDYDAIAFTTGKQQAERYNLSKQIDSLDLVPAEEGVKQFVLSAYKDGRKIINKEVNEDELPDLIGKEAAKKLLEQEITKLHRPEGIAHGNPNVFKGRELSGLDLDVGGEGMKGFYDKILPDFVNKYTKKYGMGVKKANLPSEQMPSQEAVNDYFKSINMSRQEFDKLSLDERAKILGNAAPKGDEVHFVDLTDAAKKDIKSKGQPLFSGIGLAAPGLLMDDEDNY